MSHYLPSSQVKEILEKQGNILWKISNQKFNLYFKEVYQLGGIVKEVDGDLMNPQNQWKEERIFPNMN